MVFGTPSSSKYIDKKGRKPTPPLNKGLLLIETGHWGLVGVFKNYTRLNATRLGNQIYFCNVRVCVKDCY